MALCGIEGRPRPPTGAAPNRATQPLRRATGELAPNAISTISRFPHTHSTKALHTSSHKSPPTYPPTYRACASGGRAPRWARLPASAMAASGRHPAAGGLHRLQSAQPNSQRRRLQQSSSPESTRLVPRVTSHAVSKSAGPISRIVPNSL
jgi:hypothetical protein